MLEFEEEMVDAWKKRALEESRKEISEAIINANIKGIEIGIETGIEQMGRLCALLLEENRIEDFKKVIEDESHCNMLLEEYVIKK